MSHPDLQPLATPDGHLPLVSRRDQHPRTAGLLIEAIGSDHLDIRAVGPFNTECIARIAARLNELVASANHLHINFLTVADIDDTVASLFRDTAQIVEAAGGTLALVGLHASFVDDATRESADTTNLHRVAP